MSYPKAQIWQRGSRKRPDPPKVSDGPWPFVSQRTRVLAQLRARTVQMGSSVATWLGTGADYSRAGAITMEAAVEELTPLGVLKQLKVLGAWSEVWSYCHSNLAGARDIERRAIPKCAMPAVPPPAWKLGFDKPCRSVNRARHMKGSRGKCTLELAVEFRRATGSGLDLVQKFSQVHFSHPPWADSLNLLQVA